MSHPLSCGVSSGKGVVAELSPFSVFLMLYPGTKAPTEQLKVSLFVAKDMQIPKCLSSSLNPRSNMLVCPSACVSVKS